MKSVDSGTASDLFLGRNFNKVELYEIALADGTNLYWTNYDYPVVFTHSGPRSGRVYTPRKIARSNAFSQKRGTTTSTFSLVVNDDPALTIVNGESLSKSILARRWDGAAITWLRGIAAPLNAGGTQVSVADAALMHFGRAGKIDRQERAKVSIAVNSPMELLNMDVPWRALGPDCRWTLFDLNCALSNSAFAVSGTVLAGSSAAQVLASLSNPTGYFDQGVLVWTSGANSGLRATVRSYIGTGLASAYQNLVIADKPLAYYRLNADVNDSSGHGYNGVSHGGISFTGSGGPLAGGSGYATFDGSTGYIDISALPSPRGLTNFLGAVSFEFFFNVTAAKQPNGAFGSGVQNPGINPGLWNFATSNQSNPGFKWGHNHPFADFTQISSQWVHCVVVFRGQRYIDIYLNGYLSVTVEDFGTDSWDWNAPTIGKAVVPNSYNSPGGNVHWFNGKMAEFAIYGYAMDAGQVFAHFEASQNAPVSQPSAQVNLVMPMPDVPAAGDGFTVYPGCPKSMRACALIFNNLIHFGGAPFVPPSNQAG